MQGPSSDGHGAQLAEPRPGEFQTDGEQQQGYAQFGQRAQLSDGLEGIQDRRAEQHTCDQVSDQGVLFQTLADHAEQQGSPKKRDNVYEDDPGVHAAPRGTFALLPGTNRLGITSLILVNSRASFAEAVSVALASLRSSKLRSFLTLLGIILATTTLIAVMAVVEGMDMYIAEQVTDMGAYGFRVRRMAMIGQWDPKKFLEMQRRNPELTVEEYEFIRSRVTLIREIGMDSSRIVSVRYGTDQADGVILRGVTSNAGTISNTQPVVGRFLTDVEDRRKASVAFIGVDLEERFFAGVDPIGKTFYINGRPFEVVGVARRQGSAFGQSRDNFVMIPIQTFFKMHGSRSGIGFNVLATGRENFYQAQDEVRMLLRAHRQLRPNEEDNFGMFGSDSLVAAWDQLTGVIAATAVAVVSVFMVVGGVVIMNIMLAVVSERTHEIGIRKSVGARRRDILNQFLVESSTLAAAGGVLGVLLAWVVANLVRNLTVVPMALPMVAVVLGVGLSAAVGLFFGIYPARQAALMDPIEALRMEK